MDNKSKREIQLESNLLKVLLLSGVLGYITVLGIYHFGTFYFRVMDDSVDYYGHTLSPFATDNDRYARVLITYYSPFDTKVEKTSTYKLDYLYNNFNLSNKLDFYLLAMKKDFLYVLVISIFYFGVFLFFRKNKITIV